MLLVAAWQGAAHSRVSRRRRSRGDKRDETHTLAVPLPFRSMAGGRAHLRRIKRAGKTNVK